MDWTLIMKIGGYTVPVMGGKLVKHGYNNGKCASRVGLSVFPMLFSAEIFLQHLYVAVGGDRGD